VLPPEYERFFRQEANCCSAGTTPEHTKVGCGNWPPNFSNRKAKSK